MAYVQIPKDLTKVKNKVVFNLTKRQLIGFSLAAIVSVPPFLYVKNYVGNEISMFILILLAFPFLFVTFYEKDGLKAEDYLKAMYLHEFHQPKLRIKEKEFKKQRREANEFEKKRKAKTVSHAKGKKSKRK